MADFPDASTTERFLTLLAKAAPATSSERVASPTPFPIRSGMPGSTVGGGRSAHHAQDVWTVGEQLDRSLQDYETIDAESAMSLLTHTRKQWYGHGLPVALALVQTLPQFGIHLNRHFLGPNGCDGGIVYNGFMSPPEGSQSRDGEACLRLWLTVFRFGVMSLVMFSGAGPRRR